MKRTKYDELDERSWEDEGSCVDFGFVYRKLSYDLLCSTVLPYEIKQTLAKTFDELAEIVEERRRAKSKQHKDDVDV